MYLIPIAIIGLFGLLLYRRLVSAPRYQSLWVRFGAIASLLALSAAIFVAFAYQNGSLTSAVARIIGMVGMTWFGTAFYLLLGILLTSVVALGLRLARTGPEAIRTWHRRSVPVIIGGALLITGYGIFEARHIAVQEQTIAIEGLPAEFDGYRVALISDLHAGPIRGAGLASTVTELTNGAAPDVILLAGDLTDGTTAQFADALEPLTGLTAPDGVYAVTGNHEYYAGDAAGWVEHWRTLGLTPLLNESVQITRGSDTLRVAGVSDEAGASEVIDTGAAGAELAAGLQPDLSAALAEVTPEETSILISHQPDVATDSLVGADVDLMVSGHTHGGQIWPFTLLIPLANPTVTGLDDIDGTTTYTTRGAGTWGPPMRVLVPPEISLLTLTTG